MLKEATIKSRFCHSRDKGVSAQVTRFFNNDNNFVFCESLVHLRFEPSVKRDVIFFSSNFCFLIVSAAIAAPTAGFECSWRV